MCVGILVANVRYIKMDWILSTGSSRTGSSRTEYADWVILNRYAVWVILNG